MDTDDQHTLEDALKQAQGAFAPEDLAELRKTSPEIADLLSPAGLAKAVVHDTDPAPPAPAAPVTKPEEPVIRVVSSITTEQQDTAPVAPSPLEAEAHAPPAEPETPPPAEPEPAAVRAEPRERRERAELEPPPPAEAEDDLPRPGPHIELPTIPAPPMHEEEVEGLGEPRSPDESATTTDPAPAPVTDDSVTIPAPPMSELDQAAAVPADHTGQEEAPSYSPVSPSVAQPDSAGVAAPAPLLPASDPAQTGAPVMEHPGATPLVRPEALPHLGYAAPPQAQAAAVPVPVHGQPGAAPSQPKPSKPAKQAGRSRAQLWALAAFLLLIAGIALGVGMATSLESSGVRGLPLWNRSEPSQEPTNTDDDLEKPDEEPENSATVSTPTRRPGKRPAKRESSEGPEESAEGVSAGPSGEALRPLTVAQVKQSVAQYSPSLRQCNERERRRTKAPVDSRVVLYLKISPSGRVNQAKVRRGDASDALKLCVEQAAVRWRFPRSSDPTELETPFSLKAR